MSVFSAPGPDGIVRPPRLPLPVRATNRVAGALRAVGVPLARLDEVSLLEAATRQPSSRTRWTRSRRNAGVSFALA